MSDVPQSVLAYWQKAFAGCRPGHRAAFSCAVSDTLSPKRPAMILETTDGAIRGVIRPELAVRMGIDGVGASSIDAWRAQLNGAGVILHDPDHLFYRRNDAAAVPKADDASTVRQLTGEDRAVFDAFLAAASEQDKDDAWVELDHWAVFGGFDGARLVSVASAYPWPESPLADLGVLTLPDARGQGHARAVVQVLIGCVRARGYEPQYRCQRDNHASIGLAKACDLTLFGSWIVATDARDGGG